MSQSDDVLDDAWRLLDRVRAEWPWLAIWTSPGELLAFVTFLDGNDFSISRLVLVSSEHAPILTPISCPCSIGPRGKHVMPLQAERLEDILRLAASMALQQHPAFSTLTDGERRILVVVCRAKGEELLASLSYSCEAIENAVD